MAVNNLTLFNRKLIDFFNDLRECCPDVGSFGMLSTAIEVGIKLDPAATQKVFHTSVVEEYGEKIKNKDEAFFLEHTYDEHASTFDLQVLVNNLKHVWKNLSDDNREAIWKHLQVLVILSTRVQNA
jgi:hypothetical protein